MKNKNNNEIKTTAHSTYRCQYHVVFAPKFRRQETLKQFLSIRYNSDDYIEDRYLLALSKVIDPESQNLVGATYIKLQKPQIAYKYFIRALLMDNNQVGSINGLCQIIQLFEQVDKRPIRLIGAGIYNLSTEYEKQLSFDDYLLDTSHTQEVELKNQFDNLRRRNGLYFEGHLEQIYRWDTLHKTAEYMRKHI